MGTHGEGTVFEGVVRLEYNEQRILVSLRSKRERVVLAVYGQFCVARLHLCKRSGAPDEVVGGRFQDVVWREGVLHILSSLALRVLAVRRLLMKMLYAGSTGTLDPHPALLPNEVEPGALGLLHCSNLIKPTAILSNVAVSSRKQQVPQRKQPCDDGVPLSPRRAT